MNACQHFLHGEYPISHTFKKIQEISFGTKNTSLTWDEKLNDGYTDM